MKVKLLRTEFHSDCARGVLLIDNEIQCRTLENSKYLIDTGTYNCIKFKSPKNGDVFLLEGVNNRTLVEIHVANIASEVKSCIAVGQRFGELHGHKAVLDSRDAMIELFRTIEEDNFELEIINVWY